jgi:hypothetical protein
MYRTFSQDASLSNFLIERAKKIIRLFIKANFKEIVNSEEESLLNVLDVQQNCK